MRENQRVLGNRKPNPKRFRNQFFTKKYCNRAIGILGYSSIDQPSCARWSSHPAGNVGYNCGKPQPVVAHNYSFSKDVAARGSSIIAAKGSNKRNTRKRPAAVVTQQGLVLFLRQNSKRNSNTQGFNLDFLVIFNVSQTLFQINIVRLHGIKI